MSKTSWAKFPHAEKAYDHAGPALKKNWERLHRGDREPFPSEENLKALVEANPKLKNKAPELKQAAETLQEAWRLYHHGEFHEAADLGLSAGLLGYSVANKATNIYANYLEPNEQRKLDLFQQVAQRCEEQIAAAPKCANAFYHYAYALGRYSQGISVIKALAQGLGGKIKDALIKALKLDSDHADAHIALGAYQAEVIDKVGAMVGGLTYGAKKDSAMDHYQMALKLNPDSAIARVEYANGLAMLFGEAKMKEAEKLYREAAQCKPMDAMERLDVELAKAELEE